MSNTPADPRTVNVLWGPLIVDPKKPTKNERVVEEALRMHNIAAFKAFDPTQAARGGKSAGTGHHH